MLVWTPRTYYITGYDLQQHFPDDTVLVERYRPERVYAVCYFDREQNYYYLKRFPIESSDKTQFFLDEEGTSDFVCRTGRAGAQLEVTYAGAQASRPAERIGSRRFRRCQGAPCKGKQVTTFEVASLHFVEPKEPEEEPADPAAGDDRSGDAPAGGPPLRRERLRRMRSAQRRESNCPRGLRRCRRRRTTWSSRSNARAGIRTT